MVILLYLWRILQKHLRQRSYLNKHLQDLHFSPIRAQPLSTNTTHTPQHHHTQHTGAIKREGLNSLNYKKQKVSSTQYTHNLSSTMPEPASLLTFITHTHRTHTSPAFILEYDQMTEELSPIARGKGLILKPPLKPSSRCRAPSHTHTHTHTESHCRMSARSNFWVGNDPTHQLYRRIVSFQHYFHLLFSPWLIYWLQVSVCVSVPFQVIFASPV